MEALFAALPAATQHDIIQQVKVLRVSAIVLLGIGFVCVVLRIYVRARLIRALGYDDWFMLLSYVRRLLHRNMTPADPG